MPEIELGLILRAFDRTEGAVQQLSTECGSLQNAIVGLGGEMAKGGTAGREAMSAYRDLNRELTASDKAASLSVKAWKDQNDVLFAAIDVGDQFARTVNRGMNMLNQYNVSSIRVTEAEQLQVTASQSLEAAKARLADVMEKEPGNAQAVASAQAAVTKAQDDLTKATKGTSDAQGGMNMMLVGFALQAPAFAKDIERISESAIKLYTDLMSSETFGPIFSGEMGLMTAAEEAFNFVMDQNPAVLILGAIVIAIGALWLIWDTNFLGMRDTIQSFWDEGVAPIVNKIMDIFNKLWNEVLVPLGEIFVKVFSAVIGPVVKFVWDTMIGPAVTTIVDGLNGIIDIISGVIKWINDLISAWTNWNPAPKNLTTNTVSNVTTGTGGPGFTPGGQVGFPYGVPHTGLYRLHEGETVERAGSSRLSIGTINVYANDYAGGRAAGKGLLDELRSMGVYPF